MQLLNHTANLIRFFDVKLIDGIAETHFVVDDSSATKILSNAATENVQMIIALPGVKIDGIDLDSLRSKNSLLLWVLAKGGGASYDKIIDADEYLHLLNIIDDVIEDIRKGIGHSLHGNCSLLAGLSIEQIVVTPEYNTFGGWNGWCASIALK